MKLNRCSLYFIRWVFLGLIFFVSGCSTNQQWANKIPGETSTTLHSHYAAVTNGYIEYYRFGNGSPIVLIPGYATDVSSWNREFLIALAQSHQVIVLNNRNIGRSRVRSTKYESQDLANDTYQLITVLNLKKPAVLGISMGGMIAQQLAVRHPDSLGQLILINTLIAGKQAIRPNAVVENTLLNMPTDKTGRYVVAVNYFFPPSWKMQMAYTLATDRFLPDDYQESDLATAMAKQRSLVMHWVQDNKTATKIRKLQLPVLIINGEADIVIPPENSVILAQTIPNARLVRWKEGGHAMIYQFPKQIADVVDEFILLTSAKF